MNRLEKMVKEKGLMEVALALCMDDNCSYCNYYNRDTFLCCANEDRECSNCVREYLSEEVDG